MITKYIINMEATEHQLKSAIQTLGDPAILIVNATSMQETDYIAWHLKMEGMVTGLPIEHVIWKEVPTEPGNYCLEFVYNVPVMVPCIDENDGLFPDSNDEYYKE